MGSLGRAWEELAEFGKSLGRAWGSLGSLTRAGELEKSLETLGSLRSLGTLERAEKMIKF